VYLCWGSDVDFCCNGYVDAVTARNLPARSVPFTRSFYGLVYFYAVFDKKSDARMGVAISMISVPVGTGDIPSI
jgi:hypothetical protein